MSKFLASVAAIGALGLIALTVPADAGERRTAGLQTENTQVGQWEFSDRRRYYRSRYYSGRHYRGTRYYGGYAYAPRPYYRSHYRSYYAPTPFYRY